VSANDLTDMTGDGRFVAIVMDDWNVPFDDHELILAARQVGRYLIEQLSPSDVAAVIFPQQAGRTQDFTTDRQKLIAAIDKFDPPEVNYIEKRPMGLGPGGGDMPQRFAPILMRSDCQRSQPTVPTLDTVVARLATVPNRRKTVILVSTGLPVSFSGGRGCPAELADIMKNVFRRAQRGNVNIYSVDPGGVNGYADYLQSPVRRGGRPADNVMPLGQANAAVKLRRDFMEIMADHTGARAIVNTDDLGFEIDSMMAEAASYYLVGYQTSNGQPDGKFRRLDIKVSRPGLTVRTRSGFYAPDESGTKSRESTPGSNELGLTGMASATRLALRAQVVAVAPSANPKEADVVVVLGVRTPGIRLEAVDTLTLVRTLYDASGKAGPPTQEKVPVAIPPAGNEDLRYEVFQRLTLAPGRWELRFNATSARLDTSGTVFHEFEVPDFSRRGLALSTPLLGQKVTEGRTDPLAVLIPIVPTTARDFAPGTAVTAYMRVLQVGTTQVGPVKMAVQVLNTADASVFGSSSTIEPAAFGDSRSAPFEVQLPLDKLQRGQYLLSIAAERADGAKTRSDVIFRVR
jgi:VWFA-related protein